VDPCSNIRSTSQSKGKKPARGDETHVFSTDEAEQLFDHKLAPSMDGLAKIIERMMERTLNMIAIMEREKLKDLKRMERNRREDYKRLMNRLL
jgi:superfamily II DNA/RNA helicase